MANSDASKICQGDENVCKRDVQALCFHCSKNLCRVHLLQHAQLIEEKTQTELNSLADKFNELSSRFGDLSISPDILKEPLFELQKWRVEAHRKIDEIFENKRQEMNDKITEYQDHFAAKNKEQVEKLNASKNAIAQLIQEADASRKQMDDLQTSIDEAEKYLASLNTHEVTVVTSAPMCFVDIDTQFFDCRPALTGELRVFKIIYIRLNGIIRDYYVKSKKNGTISDLKKSFIRQYTIFEELARVESNSHDMTDHQPKCDFILPVELYNHRVHSQYNEDTKLSTILDRDMIVFYETPHSLNKENSPCILMPCLFQRLPGKQAFALPIYLNLPRTGCQGQDVLNALHEILGTFFSLNPSTDRHLYKANIVFNFASKQQKTQKALNDILQDRIDFTKQNMSLMVGIDSRIADIYEQNQILYKNL